MKAVILAAGRGSRLDGRAAAKPALQVAGLPLLERVVATAHAAGIRELYLVTGHAGECVEDLALAISRRRGVAIVVLPSPDWAAGNGASLLAAQPWIDEEFLLLMADHVLDRRVLERLLAAPPSGDVLLAVDSDRANPFVDPEDVTRVLVEDSQIRDIGKGLAAYTGYDTGAFRCTPALFQAVAACAAAGDSSLSGGVRLLAQQGRVHAVDVSGLFWVDVDTPRERAAVHRALFAGLGKSADGWVARRLNRPLSRRLLTPLLLRVWPGVTPNQVSILGFLIAAAGAAAFFAGAPLLGAAAVHFASVLDGSDGEIARLKHLQSRFGGFLDSVLDRYADSLVIFAMTYAAAGGAGDRSMEAAAVTAGLLALSGTWLVSYTSAKAAADLGYTYRGRLIAAGRGRDLRLLILVLGGAAAAAEPLAMVAALGLVALLTHIVVTRRLLLAWRAASARPVLAGAQAVILDLDGTVANTMPMLTALAVRLLVRHYGLTADEAQERYLATAGAPFRTQLEELFPGDPRNDPIAAAFEEAKRATVLDVPPFAEAHTVLEGLRRAGLRCFLVSSTDQDLVTAYVVRHGLGRWFDACLGATPGQGKPAQIRRLLDRYGLASRHAILAGDSLRDGDYARAAGVRFVGLRRIHDEAAFLRRGLRSVRDLRALVADVEREQALHAALAPLRASVPEGLNWRPGRVPADVALSASAADLNSGPTVAGATTGAAAAIPPSSRSPS